MIDRDLVAKLSKHAELFHDVPDHVTLCEERVDYWLGSFINGQYLAREAATRIASLTARVSELEQDGWRLITDDPPLDRPFLGARVGSIREDGFERPDGIWHIRGRHIDYHGEGHADKWTWNEAGGGYGIYLTHWRELPALPARSLIPKP